MSLAGLYSVQVLADALMTKPRYRRWLSAPLLVVRYRRIGMPWFVALRMVRIVITETRRGHA